MADQPPPLRIRVNRNGQEFGPYTSEEARAYLSSGNLFVGDMATPENTVAWQPLGQLLGIAPPPPMYAPTQDIGQNAGMRLLLPVGRSGWAIAAGYLGLFAFVVVPAPLALLISLVAIWDIRKHRHDAQPRHGMGRAIFGLITGVLGTAFLLYLLITRMK